MTAGRSGFSSAWLPDGSPAWFQWDVEYDDVTRDLTVTASVSPAASKANLIVTLQNGSERTYDLLTLGAGGTSILNQGPQVFPNVNLKMGTARGNGGVNVGVISIRDDWTPAYA